MGAAFFMRGCHFPGDARGNSHQYPDHQPSGGSGNADRGDHLPRASCTITGVAGRKAFAPSILRRP